LSDFLKQSLDVGKMKRNKKEQVNKNTKPIEPKNDPKERGNRDAVIQNQFDDVSISEDEELHQQNDEESDLSSDSEDSSWISWFCGLKGNEYFTEIDEEFIQDDFNLTGLSGMVPNYDYALDMLLDSELDDLTPDQMEVIQAASEMLYGLIHARYVLTARGLSQMLEKYNNVEFGRCPRVFCQGQPVLPVGQSDIPRTNTVKLFCPKCQDIYYPKLARHQNIDGSYFGTTFPHMLLQAYPELVPTKPSFSYAPKIFGFKIHKSSTNYPRPARDKNKMTNGNGNILGNVNNTNNNHNNNSNSNNNNLPTNTSIKQ